jgi:predicted choloylglycine hydrolase
MECTIGWIITKKGFILFKNRDRDKEEPKENLFSRNRSLICFEDRRFRGCWIGINRHGLGVSSSTGPNRDVPEGFHCENEIFEINRIVLEKAKSVEEAAKLYIKLFKEKRIGKSYNVIICDKNHANIIELIPNKSSVRIAKDSAFRTNNFETMREFNTNPERTKRSYLRLKKTLELAKGVKEAEDLTPILSFHSKDNYENICRHDAALTMGSAIFEVNGNEAAVYYLLNKSPCEGKYKKEVLRF